MNWLQHTDTELQRSIYEQGYQHRAAGEDRRAGMSDKHTPGPWSFIKEHNGHRITAAVNGPDDTLARTYEYAARGINGVTRLPDEANARVMSAAADMLFALRQANIHIAHLHSIVEDEISESQALAIDPTLAAIRAAIAKATGEA